MRLKQTSAGIFYTPADVEFSNDGNTGICYDIKDFDCVEFYSSDFQSGLLEP
jgi:hypothetical protein